jgi:DNA-binding NtrC family response regulator
MTSRVLIIDDEPALRRTLERALQNVGFEPVAVGDAALAYAMLDGESFDLVLLDIHLPQISGDALFLAMIRRWPRLSRRIVLMTGDPSAIRADWPVELAACSVLSKPFTLETLRAVVLNTVVAAQAAEGERKAGGHG